MVPTPRPRDASVWATPGAALMPVAVSNAMTARFTGAKLRGLERDGTGWKSEGAQRTAPLCGQALLAVVTDGDYPTDRPCGPAPRASPASPGCSGSRRDLELPESLERPASRRSGCALLGPGASRHPPADGSPDVRLPVNATRPWLSPGRMRGRWGAAAAAPPPG